MRLFYCPVCSRVYYLSEDSDYLCGRSHAALVGPDGKTRRFVIQGKTESNKPPWPIPRVVEERVILSQEMTESWLDECKYPDDTDYGDTRRHFGYGAPGRRHLTSQQVLDIYRDFVLKRVETGPSGWNPEFNAESTN